MIDDAQEGLFAVFDDPARLADALCDVVGLPKDERRGMRGVGLGVGRARANVRSTGKLLSEKLFSSSSSDAPELLGIRREETNA
jgi:hypothetical protein